jgi:hypothetical protein
MADGEARRNLHDALRRLYGFVLEPPLRVLQTKAEEEGVKLSRSTADNLLHPERGRQARLESVLAFVTACERYARTLRPPRTVLPELLDRDRWAELHRAAEREYAPEPAARRDRAPSVIGSIPAQANAYQHRAEGRILEAALAASGAVVLTAETRVLTGLGGVGKTQLAAAYARRAVRDRSVDQLIWISATSREAILAAYAEAVSSAIGESAAGSAEQAAERFLAWLESTDERWLVVLDDLQLPEDLARLWPPQSPIGRTIVTTRWRDAVFESHGRRLVEVGMFAPDEAARYLTTALADHSDLGDDVDGVAEALGYLPLALSHAAAYMINGDVRCSYYRQLFTERRKGVLELFADETGIPDDYRKTIATTWLLSIEAADRLAPAGLAKPLLQLASVLDPNGVVDAVFTTAAARDWLAGQRVGPGRVEVTEDDARQGLRCLRRLSLAAVEHGMVRVHALVQRATLDGLGEAELRVHAAAARALDEACTTIEEADWQLFAMLVRAAEAAGDEGRKRDVFGRLLDMLDRKHLNDQAMGRAWDATYVLRDTIVLLLPLILDCLDTDNEAASVGPNDGPRASRIDPEPALTQEAASSLASVFPSLDDWRLGLPERAIRVLEGGLIRWHLRKRFVEALAVYHHPGALSAILEFGRKELDGDADRIALDAVAVALCRLGGEFGESERAASVAVLSRIAALDGPRRKTVRAAIKARNFLTDTAEEPPAIDEAEVITYLNPIGDRGRASDWADIQEYAGHVERSLTPYGLSPAVVDALLLAFAHPQTVARIAVARCLGRLDEVRARYALEEQLRRPRLPADLRQACFDALLEQAARVPSTPLRAARRWQAVHAASLGSGSAQLELTVPHITGEPLVTLGAFGLTAPSVEISVAVSAASAGNLPQHEQVARLVTPEDIDAVGPDLEAKYRISSLRQPDATSLAVALIGVTWRTGASFHRALRRSTPLPVADQDDLLRAVAEETVSLPGIAGVHCLLCTPDDEVVAVRRPKRVAYFGDRWSVSYEEQLTEADLADDREDPFSAAARRGYAEEFKLPAGELRIRIVSAVVEAEIFNRVLLALVETPATPYELRNGDGTERPEIGDVRIISGAPTALRREAMRDDLHPTSALRLQTLAALRPW